MAWILTWRVPNEEPNVTSHDRSQLEHGRLTGARTFVPALTNESGIHQAALPPGIEARITVDLAPRTPWVAGALSALTLALDVDTLPPGHHVLFCELRGTSATPVIPAPAHFHTGPPPAAGDVVDVWVSANKFETRATPALGTLRPVKLKHRVGTRYRPAREPWLLLPGVQPWPSKTGAGVDRQATQAELWVEGWSLAKVATVKMPTRLASGHIGSGVKQTWHYGDAMRSDPRQKHFATHIPAWEGPAGVGCLGITVHGQIGPAWPDYSCYGVSSAPGCLWRIAPDGQATILAGHRMRLQTESGYWGDGLNTSVDWEIAGAWVDGSEPGFVEPQGSTYLLSRRRPGDPWMMDFLVADTLRDRLVLVDARPTLDGRPAECRTVLRFLAGSQPTAVAELPDGRIAVTLFGAHQVVLVDPATWAITPLLMSTITAIPGVTGRGEANPAGTDAELLARYYRTGGPGAHAVPFPQDVAVDSAGLLLLTGKYTKTVSELDPDTGVVRGPIMQGKGALRDCRVSVNRDGTTGPKDSIRFSGWAAQSQVHVTRTGAWLGSVYADEPTRWFTRGPYTHFQGLFNVFGHASGQGWLVPMQSSGPGLPWIRAKRPSDPPLPARLPSGMSVFLAGQAPGGPQRHSLFVSHGPDWQGHFDVGKTVDEMAAMSDAALAAWLQAGAGTGVPWPELTGQALADLITHVRWCGRARALPPVDLTPPPAPAMRLGTVTRA